MSNETTTIDETSGCRCAAEKPNLEQSLVNGADQVRTRSPLLKRATWVLARRIRHVSLDFCGCVCSQVNMLGSGSVGGAAAAISLLGDISGQVHCSTALAIDSIGARITSGGDGAHGGATGASILGAATTRGAVSARSDVSGHVDLDCALPTGSIGARITSGGNGAHGRATDATDVDGASNRVATGVCAGGDQGARTTTARVHGSHTHACIQGGMVGMAGDVWEGRRPRGAQCVLLLLCVRRRW